MQSLHSISLSALQTFSLRQAVTANNVANSGSEGFKASFVRMQVQPSGGVTADVVGGNDAVDISKEAVDLLSNSSGFKANLKVVQASDEMDKTILNIKA